MTNSPDTAPSGNADKESAAGSKPLPSFEDIMRPPVEVFDPLGPLAVEFSHNRIIYNPKIRGIRWTLNGPLETAITVTRDWNFDPDEVPEPYYQGLNENGRQIWHPFAHVAITKPKVSSLKLYVEPLDKWDYNWMEVHEGHTDPDETHDPSEVLYGPLPGVTEADGLDGDQNLLVCCGSKRPWHRGTELLVKATGAFLTIHDFVSVVHPYLMARRGDILDSMNLDWGRTRKPFQPETKLMVEWAGSRAVNIKEEAEWMECHTRHRWKAKPYSNGFPVALCKEMVATGRKSEEGRAIMTRKETSWGPEDD
jgi:hypothetical protein